MKNKFILSLLLILYLIMCNEVFGQADALSHSRVTGQYVGWDATGTAGSLDVANGTSNPIDFYINGGPWVQFLPSGDVNVVQGTDGYMINSIYVLRHNDNVSNIFVGVNAGNTNAIDNNVFVGYNAGVNTGDGGLDGYSNTFVGYAAGPSNDFGYQNSFFGDSSGFTNYDGYHNTFIGYKAGFENFTGNSSVFVGADAGHSSTNNYNTMVGRNCGYYNQGSYNCFYGKDAGFNNKGDGNCFYGHHSGYVGNVGQSFGNSFYGYLSGVSLANGNLNCFYGGFAANNVIAGDSNVFIGYRSQINATTTINNSIAIGYESSATTDRKMILGSNVHNVGIGLSNDALFGGPRSKLEINSSLTTTNVGQSTGSGLQFRQLTSGSSINGNTYIAPWGKVLTVDADGKVKLTDQQQIIGYSKCSDMTELSESVGIKMNDFNIYYKGQGFKGDPYSMLDGVGIGVNCGDALPGKLTVEQNYGEIDQATLSGYFHNGDIAPNSGNEFEKTALLAISDGYFNAEELDIKNVGGDFAATNCNETNIAVRGQSGISSTGEEPSTYGRTGIGGLFRAIGSGGFNIGVYTEADKTAWANYGIVAVAQVGTCTTGVGTCSDAAGYFNGDVYTTNQYYDASDQNLKDNIQPLENSVNVIKQLNPKTYTFRTNQFQNLNLPKGNQSGLIAQEVQSVLPNLVKSFVPPPVVNDSGKFDYSGSSTPYLAVNYQGIIPYLIGAIQEQQKSIDSLSNLIAEAQTQINNCCRSNERGANSRGATEDNNNENRSTIEVKLSDARTIILDQNSPNPFSEETFITYVIPNTVRKAQIMIFDKVGNVLKTIEIPERGEGRLHVYSEKLSSGVYSYSLVADGITIDTKKMVCEK